MNVHKNAKQTPRGREQLVRLVLSGVDRYPKSIGMRKCRININSKPDNYSASDKNEIKRWTPEFRYGLMVD